MNWPVDIEGIILAEEKRRKENPPHRPAEHYNGGAVFLTALGTIGDKLDIDASPLTIEGRNSILRSLLRDSLPEDEDKPSAFRAQVTLLEIKPEQLLAGLYLAPQWCVIAAKALNWPGVDDMIWWLHAHPPDWSMVTLYPYNTLHSQVHQKYELWRQAIHVRMTILFQELVDGEIDLEWFWRAYSAIDTKHWNILRQHLRTNRRSTLCADALLGKLDQNSLFERLLTRRYQDAARAIGLLPLSEQDPNGDLGQRYEVLQQFLRHQRGGVERRVNERLAVETALSHLARQAGYSDQIHMSWRLEAKAISELAQPLSVAQEPYQVSFEINKFGEPIVQVERDGRLLRRVPRTLKKDPVIKGLIDRKSKLKEKGSLIRLALERAMVESTVFRVSELQALMKIPFLDHLFSGSLPQSCW